MKVSSKSIDEHGDVLAADDGRWSELVARWSRRDQPAKARSSRGNACYVVSVWRPREGGDPTRQAMEIITLVGAQGDRVVGQESLRMGGRPAAKTYLGQGATDAIAERAFKAGADLVVLDADLSPSQMRNIEEAIGMPVSDREAVILNVFLLRAQTKRARIQAEVAQLEYLRPRIRGLGLEMDQQAGGIMGSRGPGETASELLARRLDGRLADLRALLSRLQRASGTQRQSRARCARVAMVGYTNAGKTSLMNALTNATLSARDMPFETLDTTVRCLTRHGGDVVISDTVGFIRRLPTRLLASFESTLAEACESSLLAIVLDVSDPEWPDHLATTQGVLDHLGADKIPRHYVCNKADALSTTALRDVRIQLAAKFDPRAYSLLSAHSETEVAALRKRLIDDSRHDHVVARVFVSYGDGHAMAKLHAGCRVLLADAKQHGIRFVVHADKRTVETLRRESQRRSK